MIVSGPVVVIRLQRLMTSSCSSEGKTLEQVLFEDVSLNQLWSFLEDHGFLVLRC
jgi:hypothetical protein